MKTKDLVLIALFTALTIAGGFLNIPTPTVSFSLQFVFCAYAGVLLGAKRALLSQLLYIAIGLAGLPVFTKGGGLSYVFQPSFGFLLGFALCAFVIGWIVERTQNPSMLTLLTAVTAGLLTTYLVGVPYLYFIVNYLSAPGSGISFATAISLGVAPFVLFDLLKVLLVAVTGLKILPALRRFH